MTPEAIELFQYNRLIFINDVKSLN